MLPSLAMDVGMQNADRNDTPSIASTRKRIANDGASYDHVTNSGLKAAFELSKEELEEKLSSKLRNEAHTEVLKSQKESIESTMKRSKIDDINTFLADLDLPPSLKEKLLKQKWDLMGNY